MSAPAPAAPPPPAPPKSKFYDAAIARKLFQAYGTSKPWLRSAVFVENDKASKGGLFLQGSGQSDVFIESGEVSLAAGGRVLDAVGTGEVFGEMAVITGGPRSATATAKVDCTAYALDAAQFQSAIQKCRNSR